MVFISGIIFTTMRFEKVVTSGQLEGHASCGPNVGGRTISGAKKDFQTPILSCLNIFREVMVLQNIGKWNLYNKEQAPSQRRQCGTSRIFLPCIFYVKLIIFKIILFLTKVHGRQAKFPDCIYYISGNFTWRPCTNTSTSVTIIDVK